MKGYEEDKIKINEFNFELSEIEIDFVINILSEVANQGNKPSDKLAYEFLMNIINKMRKQYESQRID